MNSRNKAIINGIITACHQYRNRTEGIFIDYSQRKEAARAASRAYKDEEQRFEAERRQLAEETRSKLKSAADSFAKEITTAKQQLKTEFERHLAQPCNGEALNRIRTLKDFGLLPTKSEVETLLHQINGNHIGLAALEKTLAENKSPFTVRFKSVSDFEKDLETVGFLAENAYGFSTLDCHSSACSVFRDVPIERHRADGTVFSTGEVWSTIPLTMRRAMFTDAVKKIEGMVDSWSADCSYEIADRAAVEEQEQARKEAEEVGEEFVPDPEPASSIAVGNAKVSGIVDSLKEAERNNAATARAVKAEYYR